MVVPLTTVMVYLTRTFADVQVRTKRQLSRSPQVARDAAFWVSILSQLFVLVYVLGVARGKPSLLCDSIILQSFRARRQGPPSLYRPGGYHMPHQYMHIFSRLHAFLAIPNINVWLGQIVPRVVLELRQGSPLSQADLREMAELLVAEAVQRG